MPQLEFCIASLDSPASSPAGHDTMHSSVKHRASLTTCKAQGKFSLWQHQTRAAMMAFVLWVCLFLHCMFSCEKQCDKHNHTTCWWFNSRNVHTWSGNTRHIRCLASETTIRYKTLQHFGTVIISCLWPTLCRGGGGGVFIWGWDIPKKKRSSVLTVLQSIVAQANWLLTSPSSLALSCSAFCCFILKSLICLLNSPVGWKSWELHWVFYKVGMKLSIVRTEDGIWMHSDSPTLRCCYCSYHTLCSTIWD